MERLICTSCKTTVDKHEGGGIACECQHRHPADPINDPYADTWMYVTDACDLKGPYPGVGGVVEKLLCDVCGKYMVNPGGFCPGCGWCRPSPCPCCARLRDLDNITEKYISGLPWSRHASDADKLLVAGNIRSYRTFIAKYIEEG